MKEILLTEKEMVFLVLLYFHVSSKWSKNRASKTNQKWAIPEKNQTGERGHSVHWDINRPFKNTPLFLAKPTLNPETVQALLFLGNLSKVTKFLGETSQFEFLVMTEKNIFACKLYLSLNISDFNLFFM